MLYCTKRTFCTNEVSQVEEYVDYYKSASEVRKEWSRTIDTVIRERPVFIQRTRDNLIMLDLATLRAAFLQIPFNVTVYKEEDGSVTCVEDQLDLVENASTEKECIRQLIGAMRDYANDFYQEFSLWSKAPNRRDHIPLVLKILASTDEEILEDIKYHAGKN